MPRLLVYEFLTSGGTLGRPELRLPSLLAEGEAMLRSVAADFAALNNVQVVVLRDARLAALEIPRCQVLLVEDSQQETELLRAAAATADWSVIIAPEIGGALLDASALVRDSGGRLLGPALNFVALASDKHATAMRLRARGVPTPFGVVVADFEEAPRDFPYPAVLKPRDGAGSQDVQLLRDSTALIELNRAQARDATQYRLEQYCPGLAASVAFLCGPRVRHPLPPCRQHLSEDGRFEYFGGSLPLPAPLAQRATSLAVRALNALPPALGYIGIDLVLGADANGADDVVIEVNPRLTTSYVGLRAATANNLAGAMLALAEGRDSALEFRDVAIRFTPHGEVFRDP